MDHVQKAVDFELDQTKRNLERLKRDLAFSISHIDSQKAEVAYVEQKAYDLQRFLDNYPCPS